MCALNLGDLSVDIVKIILQEQSNSVLFLSKVLNIKLSLDLGIEILYEPFVSYITYS